MTLLEWSEALSLGVGPIDEQHKILLDIMNDLNENIIHGKGQEGCLRALEHMQDYAQRHFIDEEALMSRTEFPGLEGHRKLHAWFWEKIEAFAEMDMNASPEVALRMLAFLQDWLVDHILGPDLLFAHHYKAHLHV